MILSVRMTGQLLFYKNIALPSKSNTIKKNQLFIVSIIKMGNSNSQNTATNGVVEIPSTPLSPHAGLVRPHSALVHSSLSRRDSIILELDWDWESKQQLAHKPIARISSHRGYRPRSASLRRMRSIQSRRFLEGSNVKSNNYRSSKKALELEAQEKKVGEENALLAACARGDLSKVERLVDSGVDVNSSDYSKMTALHYAAMHARDDVIKCLISRGAEVNTADMKGGSSAMHWVVNNSVPKYGSIEGSLTALTKAGCNVNATDFNFATPLHIAAQKGDRDGVQVLLRLGADPNKRDITGRNCFEVAKNAQMKSYMITLFDMSSSKDDQLEKVHVYHILEPPLPTIPPPLPRFPPPEHPHFGESNKEEHIYSFPDFHSPPFPSALRPRSIFLNLPSLPHRQSLHPLYDGESPLYDVLEHFKTQQSIIPTPPRRRKFPTPPRRRKFHLQ